MHLSRDLKLAILKTALLIEKVASIRMKSAEEERIQKVLEVYEKERIESEKVLENAIGKFIKNQIDDAIQVLSSLEEIPADLSTLFDLKTSHKELIDITLPLVAQIMGSAAFKELSRSGIDLKVIQSKSMDASDWLDSPGESPLDEIDFNFGTATISMGFLREYPEWMKTSIRVSLEETFKQEYWSDISSTTLKDIEKKLLEGVFDGTSISKIAQGLAQYFIEDGDYAFQRARLIAKTEIGHVLNAARSMAMDALIQEAGVDVPMGKQWRSVLSLTTRDTHANLDGVPADANNRWYLGGVYCRWPGDIVLPAKERVNCQCTVVMTFGLSEMDTRRLLESYSERIAEKKTLFISKGQHVNVELSKRSSSSLTG